EGWTKTEEQAFRSWYSRISRELDLSDDPDDPNHFYNYRFAFRAGVGPDSDGHWPSRFKTAEHPNRFIDGIDTITNTPQAGILAYRHVDPYRGAPMPHTRP